MLDLLDVHSVVYALAGVAALGGALLPRLIGHLPASPPMVFLALGVLVFSLPLGFLAGALARRIPIDWTPPGTPTGQRAP